MLRMEKHDCMFRPAVYFLLKGDEVVYVGKDRRPPSRIQQHRIENVKDFDSAYLLYVTDEDIEAVKATDIGQWRGQWHNRALSLLEGEWIRRLFPKYNKTLPAGAQCVKKSAVLNWRGDQ
jgi:hypothetical protein